jgi:hypothetical protein
VARIMIRCPVFDRAVSTGLTTDAIQLDSIDIPLTLRCPACLRFHKWKQSDAWIEVDHNGPTKPS